MSPTRDPAEISAPKDPAEYRAPRMMGPTFWAMIALCVICVLAGAAVGLVLPRVLANKPQPRPAAEALPPVEAPPPATAPVTVPGPDGAIQPAGVGSAEIDRLNARIAALETQEHSTTQAAAAALAAAAMVEATQRSGPFVEELSALRAAAPGAPELAVLTRLAEVGAPSRAALAASFPDYAARAASAARAPGDDARIADRIVYALSKIVAVRRVGEVAGAGPDAQLARAERLVEDGDLDGALRVLDKLSPAAREAMAPWRVRAERRAEIDRQAAALRARALRDLAHAPGSGA
jgi:hypothetical protein